MYIYIFIYYIIFDNFCICRLSFSFGYLEHSHTVRDRTAAFSDDTELYYYFYLLLSWWQDCGVMCSVPFS